MGYDKLGFPAQGRTEFHYADVLPIKSVAATVWLTEFENGQKVLQVWHKDAKIEDIVEATRVARPGEKFTVGSIDVGAFEISKVQLSYANARKVNQDLIMVV
jgi:hypothetical protein